VRRPFIVSLSFAAIACSARPPVKSLPGVPRTQMIQCPSHSLGVSLSRSATGYEGFARDNYEKAVFPRCSYAQSEVRCEGTWEFSNSPARLRIAPGPDGKLRATITSASRGENSYPCFATDVGLGPCLLNPGTATCPNPPQP
jgi:hypothetical protein